MNYTVKEVKKEIKNGIKGYMLKDEKGNYICKKTSRIPFYLEGKPGIGKTEIVKQIAEELEIGFVSFSITHHTRNSLLGLPVITDLPNGKYTEYTMSEIIASVVEKEQEGQKEGILLLDEFNCASETIMPTMLAFLQTRNIGRHELPEGWSIVLCGNPREFNKSARSFDAVILDRVRKLSVEYELKDFLEYAKEHRFHNSIIEFLEAHNQYFYRCNMAEGKNEVVTCRGWENLSCAMKAYEKLGQEIDEKLISQYIKSEEITHFFYNFYWMTLENMGGKELQEIMQRKNIERHVAKANEQEFQYRWNLVDILGNKLEGCVFEKERANVISKKIENIFFFLSKMAENDMLTEKMFYFINSKPELLKVLGKVKNEAYLNLCRKEYGILAETDKISA